MQVTILAKALQCIVCAQRMKVLNNINLILHLSLPLGVKPKYNF